MTKPEDKTPKDVLDWLNLKRVPDWTKARPIGALVTTLLALLFIGALIALVAVLVHTIRLSMTAGSEGPNLGAGALIAAMLGAPFVIWGTVIKHKTLALSETSLFNDKVNAAVEALHSRRQVTREITVDE